MENYSMCKKKLSETLTDLATNIRPECQQKQLTAQEIEDQYLWERRTIILVRVLSNRLYQQQRQTIMERRDQLLKLVSIISGTAIFVDLQTSFDLVKWLGAPIAIAGVFSLVFNYAAKASDASKRYSDWTQLNRLIAAKGERDFTEEDLKEWDAKANEIEIGEMALNRVLMLKCNVDACSITKCQPGKAVTWKDRRLFYFLV